MRSATMMKSKAISSIESIETSDFQRTRHLISLISAVDILELQSGIGAGCLFLLAQEIP